ncbi:MULTISPECIES: cytochrome b/b6 domain-containing protein [Streptomyces]|uniref:Cytochrome b/b6 domain-containing protein n=1 Tax=Streptomyces eurythermus TaxID=42237 RepID=A0ABW6YZS7_9ACTN|nr:cytochrome b/b6 domain-containing protein [Streptomyces sp. DSM 40868]QIS75348.1 formate dehydrogenase [Streptomyces sp. DSM 40868]
MPSTAGSTARTGTPTRPDAAGRVRRFGAAQRLVHRATGYLMLLCLVSAACLYIGPLALLVGRRPLMVTVHEWSGIFLPLPFLLGLLSAEFRADLRRLNRFAVYDRQWLRAVRRRRTAPGARPAGKFNAGQKLYAGWLAGAVLTMTSTGLLMWCTGLLPLISRTSAIFVHDLLAWAITFVLIGHARRALGDPEARLGMRTGYVSRSWAETHHPRWLEEDGMDVVTDESDTRPSPP